MWNISRKKTRKYLFQKLFSDAHNFSSNWDFESSFLLDTIKDNMDMDYVIEMEFLIKEKEVYLIEILKKFAPKFEPENMNLTYVIPVFIWATEMLFLKEEIPVRVSINEAIELSKVFWDESAKKIVNWILNKLMENCNEIKEEFNGKKLEKNFSFFKQF